MNILYKLKNLKNTPVKDLNIFKNKSFRILNNLNNQFLIKSKSYKNIILKVLHYSGDKNLKKLNNLKTIILKKTNTFRNKTSNNIIKFLNKQSTSSYLEQPVYLAKLFSGFIVFSSGLGILWLGFAKTEQIIQTKGVLEPLGRLRSVQIPEKGTIKELLIKEGDFVSKDQILIKLDNILPNINLESLENRIKIKKEIIDDKTKELSRTIDILNIDIESTKEKYNIEKDILDQYFILMEEGAVSRNAYLSQKVKVIEVDSNYQQLLADKKRKVLVINQKIDADLIDLNQMESKILEIKNIKSINNIKSPVNGYILDLKPLGTGYVAQSTETILKIVPKNSLIAIIDIQSSDIGFINTGKDVDISIDSFPARDFGSVEGILYDLSSSALEPDNENKELHYKGKVKLDSQILKSKKGIDLNLRPGMSLTANIKLRKASYLELLLSSFKDKADSLNKL